MSLRSLLFSLLVFVVCFSSAFATSDGVVVPPQDMEKIEKMLCQNDACVFDARIVLKQKDGSTYDKTIHVLPVVQRGGIAVYAGQSVLFEADVVGDRLANVHRVTSVQNPGNTLSATLTQVEDGSMQLVVRNPFKRPVKIAMGIMPLDRHDLLSTSSCPAVPGGSDIETWPYPLFQVFLGDMHLLKDLSHVSCSE